MISYVNMTSQNWTTMIYEKEDVLGVSYYSFGQQNQTNETVVDSRVEVIDLTGPVAGHQYVSISGLGPQNHTVNMTANMIVTPDDQLRPSRWVSAKSFNNETLMVEDYLNMTGSDISGIEFGYILRNGN